MAGGLRTILVEGHTDRRCIAGSLESGCRDNRCLSTFRANWTLEEIERFQPELGEYANASCQPLFGAAGYGFDRPRGRAPWPSETSAAGEDEEGPKGCLRYADNAYDRRITLRFVMHVPHVRDGVGGDAPAVELDWQEAKRRALDAAEGLRGDAAAQPE